MNKIETNFLTGEPIKKHTFELPLPVEIEEDMFAQRKQEFDERVRKLALENNWTPRKAKRALLAHSNKQLKKFQKQVAKNKNVSKPLIELTEEEINGTD